jgi:hypothetical protein
VPKTSETRQIEKINAKNDNATSSKTIGCIILVIWQTVDTIGLEVFGFPGRHVGGLQIGERSDLYIISLVLSNLL